MTVVAIDGSLRVQHSGSTGWIMADTGQSLKPGARVRSWDDSKAELKLKSKGEVRLGSETTIRVPSQDSLEAGRSHGLEIVEGNVWWNIKSLKSDSAGICFVHMKMGNLIVSSPADERLTARIAVGSDATTEIKVYVGACAAAFVPAGREADTSLAKAVDSSQTTVSPDTVSKPWSLTLKAMEKGIVSSAGQVVFNGQFSSDDIDENTAWVKWNEGRDSLK